MNLIVFSIPVFKYSLYIEFKSFTFRPYLEKRWTLF